MKRTAGMLMVAFVLSLLMLASPQVTSAAGTRNYSCTIGGFGGQQYCAQFPVENGEVMQICLSSTTYGYPGGFYVRNEAGQNVGSVELYPGECKNVYTNNTGGRRVISMYIDSRSYGYQQVYTGLVRTFPQ